MTNPITWWQAFCLAISIIKTFLMLVSLVTCAALTVTIAFFVVKYLVLAIALIVTSIAREVRAIPLRRNAPLFGRNSRVSRRH